MYDSSTRILIVDDMKVFRIFLTKLLSDLGLKNVQEASSAEEAWDQVNAAKSPFQLIISDLSMPGWGGMELLKRLRAHQDYSKVPFIFATAEGEVTEMEAALKLGVSAYLLKPININILRERLNALASGKS